MFDQIFLSQQVKRSMIISNESGIQELPHELPNELRLMPRACSPMGGLNAHTRKKKTQDFKKLGNIRIRIKLELQPSAQSSCQNIFFFRYQQNTPEKQKLNFSRCALFHTKTGICLVVSKICSRLQRQYVYLKILLLMLVRIETNQRFAFLYKLQPCFVFAIFLFK